MYMSIRVRKLVMELTITGHGKSWKSHGILQLHRCMNPAKLFIDHLNISDGFENW